MSSATQKNAGHSVTQIALLGAVAASFAWGCVSSNSNNNGTGGTPAATGGTITSAGGTAGSGATGLGGTTSTAGASGALPAAVACPALTTALITDFAYAPVDAGVPVPNAVSFGDFKTTFSGGTYIYPDSASVAQPALTSDITQSNWHISGTVGTYSGFGLYWNGCAQVDASAYKGISMTISGTIPASSLYLSVNTAEDTITTAWYAANTTPAPTAGTFGTCTPKTQYDGICSAPSANILVTATPTPVTIPWASLIGGKPNASVTPSKLTGITFYFSWSSGSYPVDITIDNLSFAQ
jgi:hypothetical protein